MRPHTVLVADDERPARAKLARLLKIDSRFELVAEATNGREALARIAAHSPALAILDVRMPGLDGFQVIEAASADLAVIFSTAHSEHALRAFDARAVDYLLKPFAAARLQQSLDRVHDELVAGRARRRADRVEPAPAGDRPRLLFKTSAGLTPIERSTIVRVCAAGKHVRVVTTQATHVVRESLSEMGLRLPPPEFVRTHRSEIVNVSHVVRLGAWTHGDGILTLSDGSTAVLTRTYRATFLDHFR